MQSTLKTFANISTLADAWSVDGCTGGPSGTGTVQRFSLKFRTEKALLTTAVLAYYQGTASWDAADIKCKLKDTEMFDLPEGEWKNNGFSMQTEKREAVCTLVLEMKTA